MAARRGRFGVYQLWAGLVLVAGCLEVGFAQARAQGKSVPGLRPGMGAHAAYPGDQRRQTASPYDCRTYGQGDAADGQYAPQGGDQSGQDHQGAAREATAVYSLREEDVGLLHCRAQTPHRTSRAACAGTCGGQEPFGRSQDCHGQSGRGDRGAACYGNPGRTTECRGRVDEHGQAPCGAGTSPGLGAGYDGFAASLQGRQASGLSWLGKGSAGQGIRDVSISWCPGGPARYSAARTWVARGGGRPVNSPGTSACQRWHKAYLWCYFSNGGVYASSAISTALTTCGAAMLGGTTCSETSRRWDWGFRRATASYCYAGQATRRDQGDYKASASTSRCYRPYTAAETGTAQGRRRQKSCIAALPRTPDARSGAISHGNCPHRDETGAADHVSGRRPRPSGCGTGLPRLFWDGVTRGRQESWVNCGVSWRSNRLGCPRPIAEPCFYACVLPGVTHHPGQCWSPVRAHSFLPRLLRFHTCSVGRAFADLPSFLAPTRPVCFHWVCASCPPRSVFPPEVQASSFLDCWVGRPSLFSHISGPCQAVGSVQDVAGSVVRGVRLASCLDPRTFSPHGDSRKFSRDVRALRGCLSDLTSFSTMGAPKRGIGGSGSSAPSAGQATASQTDLIPGFSPIGFRHQSTEPDVPLSFPASPITTLFDLSAGLRRTFILHFWLSPRRISIATVGIQLESYEGAPKRGIGGSGSSAPNMPRQPAHTTSQGSFEAFTLAFLSSASRLTVPFGRSLFACIALSLWASVCRALPGRSTPLGRLFAFSTCGVPASVIVPLGAVGRVTGGGPYFAWELDKSKQGRCKRYRQKVSFDRRCSLGHTAPAVEWIWFPRRELWVWVQAVECLLAALPEALPDIPCYCEAPVLQATGHAALRHHTPQRGTTAAVHSVPTRPAADGLADCLYPFDREWPSARGCKLDQEPASSTAEQRASLETLRAFDRHEYRPWPSLPAADQFAVPSGASEGADMQVGDAAAPFVFGILVPGHVIELVEVTLIAPVDEHERARSSQQRARPNTSALVPSAYPC